jgi:hypothetical protein
MGPLCEEVKMKTCNERYCCKSYRTFAVVVIIVALCIILLTNGLIPEKFRSLDLIEFGVFTRLILFSYFVGILLPHLILSRIDISHKTSLLIHTGIYSAIIAYLCIDYFVSGGNQVVVSSRYLFRTKTMFMLKMSAVCLVGIAFTLESFFTSANKKTSSP